MICGSHLSRLTVILMIKIEDARKMILNRVKALASEKLSVQDALGRYSAEDVRSPIAIPTVDYSAMDGYAVRRQDVTAPGTRLSVAYDLPAGSWPRGPVGPNQAVRIMTGAPIPPGANAVVMREQTKEAEKQVIINRIPEKYANIRFAGEDIAPHDMVLTRGTGLGAHGIGVLVSIGRFVISCHQRPVVAILGTGDEVVDLDEALMPGKVFASNAYTLISLVTACGGIPLYLGVARDTRHALADKLAGAARADLILTSGGVSKGDYDLVWKVMTAGDNHMEFRQVGMQPGRPLAFGEINGTPAIGLPGNPAATLISFYQFARPAILKMMGSENLLLPSMIAKLKTPLKNKPDQVRFVRGILQHQGCELVVSSVGRKGFGMISAMTAGNCFIVMPEGKTAIAVDEPVECEIFDMHSFN